VEVERTRVTGKPSSEEKADVVELVSILRDVVTLDVATFLLDAVVLAGLLVVDVLQFTRFVLV
jgi:hypothetical protein